MIRIKESTKNHQDQLWRWFNYEDAKGRKGIDEVGEDITFVRGTEEADIGVSWHGAPVQSVSIPKCILMKNEPPIYNVFFGRNLSDERFTKVYASVMASHKLNNGDAYYNIPRYEFPLIKKYFEKPKTELLCMMLRNKPWSYRVNSLDYKNRNYNRNSLLKYRKNMDRALCRILGKNKYHSYGGPWCKECFHGEIDNKWEVLSKYKFIFCPENSRFDGYVTEKPIQPMCMGSIPIYFGAPDIYEYLPKGTFIDADKFNVKELAEYIKYMPHSEYIGYLKRIRKFITTDESKRFTSVEFTNKFMKVLEKIE